MTESHNKLDSFFDCQTKIVAGVFIVLDFIVLLGILGSLVFLMYYCYSNVQYVMSLLSHAQVISLQNFVLIISPIIELILFISLLAIIHIGLYVSIISPLIDQDEDFRLREFIPNIINSLGLPFLTVIGSLMTVSILDIIMNLILKLHNNSGIEQNEILINIGLILGIVIAILGLSVLIKTEHTVLDRSK